MFCQAAFQDVAHALAALGIETDVIEAPLYKDLPKAFATYVREHGATDVWFEDEIPLNEVRRDEAVTKALEEVGVSVHKTPYPWLVSGGVHTKSVGRISFYAVVSRHYGRT